VIRALFRSGIAIAFALFAARQLLYGGRDLVRYNKMREMSGDPPLGAPTGRKHETNSAARTTNPLVMLASVPSDLMHYIKMKTM
jgi:hypothetical protein